MNKCIALVIFAILLLVMVLPIAFADDHTVSLDEFDPNTNDFTTDLSTNDQALYLKDNYNNDYALDFFSDPNNLNNPNLDQSTIASYYGDTNNIGLNPGTDTQFFTGSYVSEDPTQKAAASKDHFQSYSLPHLTSDIPL